MQPFYLIGGLIVVFKVLAIATVLFFQSKLLITTHKQYI